MRSNDELSHSHARVSDAIVARSTPITPAGEAMYFILVTLSLLTSLLLHSGLGELPEECSADSSGEINH